MKSRERVLTVIKGGIPDRVPWVENHISNEVMAGLLGHENFVHCNYSHKIDSPGMIRIPPEIHKIIPIDNISYDLSPPRFAKTQKIGGQYSITEGLIKINDDLKLLNQLPNPDDDELWRPAEEYLRCYRGDLAAIGTVRSGPSNTYLSMGIENFCHSLINDPGFVKEIMWRFSEWTRKVVKNMQELPFDLCFMPDDMGFGNSPMISPSHFREFCFPAMKNVIDTVNLPVIYHSDGNIMPLMEDIIALGVKGVANFEPGAMDIEEVKKLYGHKITIIGNIDLHYTLTRGTPKETEDEVRRRLAALSPGGRYILSSSNTLPNYVKIANVRAMGKALLRYGSYKSALLLNNQPKISADDPYITKRERVLMRSDCVDYTLKDIEFDPLSLIRKAIVGRKTTEIEGHIKDALKSGFKPEEIINGALIKAMELVGEQFSENIIFVPEMLQAATTMKVGMELIKPLLRKQSVLSKGKVILATVKGDVHDIGKNLVKIMVEGSGFTVVDLGINVDGSTIIKNLKESNIKILGLSALLTTTMSEMSKIIELINKEGIREQVKVIVGGAPVTQKFANEIGADAYGQDAGVAVELCNRFIS